MEKNNKVVELYLEGYSYGKIAKELCISKSSIPYILKKNNVYTKERNARHSLIEDPHKEEIIALYNLGYSCESIAKQFNMNRSTVWKKLQKYNIKLRKVKGIKHSIRNPIITLDFFKNLITTRKDDFDYFLGIFASDGNIYKNQIRIGGIADENVEFLYHWCDFLNNKVAIHRLLRSNKTSYYNVVQFKNQDIANLLSNDYGITPNKTFTLKLPYINWNVIRGLFDGDGSLSLDKRCLSMTFKIVTESCFFAEQLCSFFTDNGLKCHIYIQNNKNPLYEVVVMRQSDIFYIYKHLYKNASYFLKRKYEKFCPLVKKFTNDESVNSVKEESNLLD